MTQSNGYLLLHTSNSALLYDMNTVFQGVGGELRKRVRRGGQIDLRPCQFCAQVVDIGGQQYRERGEETNADGRRFALLNGRSPDHTVFSNDLNAFNVIAGRFIGIVNRHAGLAFARLGIGAFTELFALIDTIVRRSTRQASRRHQGGFRIGHTVTGIRLEDGVAVGRKGSTRIVGEQAEVDIAALIGAKGTNKVLIGTAIVQFSAATKVVFFAKGIFHGIEAIVIVVAIVQAVGQINTGVTRSQAVIIGIGAFGGTVGGRIGTNVFFFIFHGRQIGLNERVHLQ
jgi:hypothetical protein